MIKPGKYAPLAIIILASFGLGHLYAYSRLQSPTDSEWKVQDNVDLNAVAYRFGQERIHSKLEVKENERFMRLRHWLSTSQASIEMKETAPLKQQSKVVLLTGCDWYDEEILASSLHNRQEYSDKHEGIINHFVNFTKFEPAAAHPLLVPWKKLPAIEEAFAAYPEAEWVWWLDMDAIIMNLSLNVSREILHPVVLQESLAFEHPLRNLASQFDGIAYPPSKDIEVKDIDFVISQDSLGLNAGSFFIRRSDFSETLLGLWKDLKSDEWQRAEQDALIHLLLSYPSLLKRVGVVPQRMFNSYHDESMSHSWRYREGDFVIHFAGQRTNKRYKWLYSSYYSQRHN